MVRDIMAIAGLICLGVGLTIATSWPFGIAAIGGVIVLWAMLEDTRK